MLLRTAIAAVLSLGVTLALFFGMRALVYMGDAALDGTEKGSVIDFVRLKRDYEPPKKKKVMPQKQQIEKPPPTPSTSTPKGEGEAGPAIAVSAPQVSSNVDLAGGLNLGAAPTDGDVVPLVRVNPIYPESAKQRGIEGFAVIKFDIGTTGRVENARVLQTEPPGVFSRAALKAVRKWKYRPKIVNGKPVVQRGLTVRLSFDLSN